MADQAAQNTLRTEFETAIAANPMTYADIVAAMEKIGELLNNMKNGDPAPNNGALTVHSDSAELANCAREINKLGNL